MNLSGNMSSSLQPSPTSSLTRLYFYSQYIHK